MRLPCCLDAGTDFFSCINQLMLVDEWFAGRILCTPSLRAGSFDPHSPAMSSMNEMEFISKLRKYRIRLVHDVSLIKEH